MITVKGKGRILEHRHVMEEHLGRRLLPEEQVHHKDHRKDNNDINNLELCPDDKSHKEQHAFTREDLLDFLIQYNDQYGHFPTYHECVEHLGMPHPSTFIRNFGSWRNAKRAAQAQLDYWNREEEANYEEAFEEEV